MALEPIKIPQNVYIEDRIVGPLTLRQIMIVGLGGGISYVIWATVSKSGDPSIIETVLSWIPGVISFIFAFVKINDLSMMKLILLMIERANKPSVRSMLPRQGISIHIRTFVDNGKKVMGGTSDAKTTQHFDDLSSTLDSVLPSVIPADATDLRAIRQSIKAAPAVSVSDAQASDLHDEPTDEPVRISAPSQLPVNKTRITATPLTPGSSLDGVVPHGGVSVFSSPSRA